jgi:hypothetical protein
LKLKYSFFTAAFGNLEVSCTKEIYHRLEDGFWLASPFASPLILMPDIIRPVVARVITVGCVNNTNKKIG